jgi:glycosyltransferase involved in cell wall biosynthesis
MKNSSKKFLFYIVIPAFKSAKVLPRTLERIPLEIYESVEQIVIVEDIDNMTDKSASKELLKKYSKCHVIYHDKNKGYGAAQKTGYAYCMKKKCDGVVLLHSDGQYDPIYLERFIDEILNKEIDVVQGSRMIIPRMALQGGMPLYKYYLNIIITYVENKIFNTNYSEFHSGYMGYSKNALNSVPFEKLSNTFHFDGEMLIMTKLKKLKFKEIAITTYYGEDTSSLNSFFYGLQIIRVVINYILGRYNLNSNKNRFD